MQQDQCPHKKRHQRASSPREDMARSNVCSREAGPHQTQPCQALVWDFWPPKLLENKSLLFKQHSLWY